MSITIAGWLFIIIGVLCAVGSIPLAVYYSNRNQKNNAVASVLTGVLCAAVIIVAVIIYSGTESGKRAYKDQESNFSSGITRTVTVYDFNGEIIKQYTGKFDVETGNADYILFDDENGKRHIIYYTTGTIIIDEE
jgi:hypothetical protein